MTNPISKIGATVAVVAGMGANLISPPPEPVAPDNSAPQEQEQETIKQHSESAEQGDRDQQAKGQEEIPKTEDDEPPSDTNQSGDESS